MCPIACTAALTASASAVLPSRSPWSTITARKRDTGWSETRSLGSKLRSLAHRNARAMESTPPLMAIPAKRSKVRFHSGSRAAPAAAAIAVASASRQILTDVAGLADAGLWEPGNAYRLQSIGEFPDADGPRTPVQDWRYRSHSPLYSRGAARRGAGGGGGGRGAAAGGRGGARAPARGGAGAGGAS